MDTIEERANRTFPDEYPFFPGSDTGTSRAKERRGYIKCAEEYESLPKIRGWVATNLGGVPQFFLGKPYRDMEFEVWKNMGEEISLPYNSFPEITWESEPVEVELLIRKV